MNVQLNILEAIDRARERAEVGIDRVGRKADWLQDGWRASAYDWLRRWLLVKNGKLFLTEDFVQFAESQGLAKPHDGRAYGAVIQRAARYGLIRKMGYAPANSSNCSPKCLWQGVSHD